jgi:hypothetical protein
MLWRGGWILKAALWWKGIVIVIRESESVSNLRIGHPSLTLPDRNSVP